MALEQVALLTREGVAPEHIIIGHVDRKLELDYHLRIAATGVYLSYDQISKAKYYPDAARAEVISALITAGHSRQIVLAGDTARRSYLLRQGGAGFVHILNTFVPLLRECGVAQAAIDDLLIHNPARALAFDPAQT